MKKIAAELTGLILFLVFSTSNVIASDAYVFAEEEFGQGFFRHRGSECFFITPAHVVEEAVDIELTTALRKNINAQLLNRYPADIAILKAELAQGEKCPQSSWGNGEKLSSLLTVYKEGIIKTKLNDGSTLQIKVSIESYDNFGYILVAPTDATTSFAKGFSGSPLYIAGEAAGMLLSVNNGVGRVFRQDALNNTVALFFGEPASVDEKGVASAGGQPSAKSASPQTGPDIGGTGKFEGKIAMGQTIDHPFEGQKNSPVILRFNKTHKKKIYKVSIINPQGDTVLKGGWQGYTNKDQAFTPAEDGTYTIRLIGGKVHGTYNFSIKQWATGAQLSGQANVIKPGDAADGKIATGAAAEYRFQGQANSPVLFRFIKTNKRKLYRAFILNSRGDSLFSAGWLGHINVDKAFTPPKDDTFTLRLTGGASFGNYAFSMQQWTTNAQLRGKANVVKAGDTVTGKLAPDALAEYRFEGKANTPVVIRFMKTNKKKFYRATIINSRGDALFKGRWIGHANQDQSFTPPEDDIYTLQLNGAYIHGEYEIRLSNLNG